MRSDRSSRSSSFQSTLSMRRATACFGADGAVLGISIHALHEESDSGDFVAPILKVISIHALHEESDISPA